MTRRSVPASKPGSTSIEASPTATLIAPGSFGGWGPADGTTVTAANAGSRSAENFRDHSYSVLAPIPCRFANRATDWPLDRHLRTSSRRCASFLCFMPSVYASARRHGAGLLVTGLRLDIEAAPNVAPLELASPLLADPPSPDEPPLAWPRDQL